MASASFVMRSKVQAKNGRNVTCRLGAADCNVDIRIVGGVFYSRDSAIIAAASDQYQLPAAQ